MAFWFRASNSRTFYWPEWRYSGRLELIVWSIPAMTVMLLGSLCWVGSHDLDPSRPLASSVKPLHVQVVSLDWKWLFIYPEQGIASVNALTIPVGTPLSFALTSSGVMNSFFVPQLGSQIYTMGKMTTRLQLQADNPGSYEGRSFNFSGDGFSDMYFFVHAVPPEQFAAWAAATKGAGPALDPQSYARAGKAEPVGAAIHLWIRQPRPVRDACRRDAAACRAASRSTIDPRRLRFELTRQTELERHPLRSADPAVRVGPDGPRHSPHSRFGSRCVGIGLISGASG